MKVGQLLASNLIKNIRKYIDYISVQALSTNSGSGHISQHAYQTAKLIRGQNRDPAIIIHGIMKRSGTVYSGELIGLHPDVHTYPRKIWEIPFLPLTGSIIKIQEDFFLNYEQNVGKIGDLDFLPIFGASFIAYLYSLVPEGQRMLLKMPGVQYLSYFYKVFPNENLLVLVRDGRDVVTSTIKTWPQLRFAEVCRRWDRSAKLILDFHKHHCGQEGYWMARFEDIIRAPEEFVEQACIHFGLDTGVYPFEKVRSLPVIGSSTTRKEGKSWMKKPRGFNPIGRWQQWSSWKKWIFKKIAGQSLIELGYCENLDW